jgi:hypothetical protein
MSARAILSEIDTNGEPVTLSASESHVLEVAGDSRLTIAVMIRAFLSVFETARLSWVQSPAPVGGKTPFSAVAQTVGFDLGTSFLDDAPTARLIRQVLGAVSEFEKAMLVAKLKGARDRKRRKGVKVEGRKSIAEQSPETVELARSLARARPKRGKRSLREVSAQLTATGRMTKTGKPYAPTAIMLMLERALAGK